MESLVGVTPEKLASAIVATIRDAMKQSGKLWKQTPPEEMHENVHVLLIRFGREICKAQGPRCSTCFLNDLCTYPSMQE